MSDINEKIESIEAKAKETISKTNEVLETYKQEQERVETIAKALGVNTNTTYATLGAVAIAIALSAYSVFKPQETLVRDPIIIERPVAPDTDAKPSDPDGKV